MLSVIEDKRVVVDGQKVEGESVIFSTQRE